MLLKLRIVLSLLIVNSNHASIQKTSIDFPIGGVYFFKYSLQIRYNMGGLSILVMNTETTWCFSKAGPE